MFVVMNRIPVRGEYHREFEERFRNRAGAVDRAPGFVRNLVLRPAEGSECHVIMTLWENRAAFEAWTRSEAFAQAHARAREHPPGMFTGRNTLEIYEVVSDSAAAPT